MQILEKKERLSEFCNPRQGKKILKIEKTNIFMKNPKIRNKKESKPKSNLNLSNKKTQ